MKTTEEYFKDWYNDVFPYGYGSGEAYTIPALKKFLELCNIGYDNSIYDYVVLEKELTPTVAWLLINTLCDSDIGVLEYGTSPRHAWLTHKGKLLKEFIQTKTEEDLIKIVCERDGNYIHCSRHYCNCGEEYKEGAKCLNPFWI